MYFWKGIMMKRFVCTLLISLILLCGCSSQYRPGIDPDPKPNPISIHQPGDEKKCYLRLKYEIAKIDQMILDSPLWFYIDFQNSEQIKVNALQQRKNVLLAIMAKKEYRL